MVALVIWVSCKLSLIVPVQFLHINNGSVEVDASIMGGQQEGKKMKVPLNSRWFIYFTLSSKSSSTSIKNDCFKCMHDPRILLRIFFFKWSIFFHCPSFFCSFIGVLVNYSDKLFKETRDLNFEVVVQVDLYSPFKLL